MSAGSMKSDQYYRDRATHYRRAAGETEDAALREQFLMLGTEYDALADDAAEKQDDTVGTPQRSLSNRARSS